LIIGFAYLFASQSTAHDEPPRGIVGGGIRPIRKMKREANMQNSSGIRDKVVVITSASSGIGEATMLLLAERGAKVVLGARIGSP